ncbi:copper resistance system multicopper oxidase [Roseateles saccharophilus]|uniref:Copper-containing nitrite reductase n=1 Tax=Roseateles saccharophilus TaxID=304 RepID=A0A4R3UXC8_ROSSA|nr:copper resistance system multicopper oxidase [Roseateles saccharophilus]MDG0833156.1 copper resistance system multicopper oxidase [Roseateles saccharophilus]TCU94624.1 CopA family copper-resistance protein [Roseateles saccharophilus]
MKPSPAAATLTPPTLSRRTLLGGLGAGSLVALAALPRRAFGMPVFDLTRLVPQTVVELTIEETDLEFGGIRRKAKTINGTVPGPTLCFHEGDAVTVRVTNKLSEDTSIHWHGLKVPANMDGVPGVSFAGIKPGDSFEYRFTVQQSGTYWYHSHSGLQEPEGMYAPLVILPRHRDPFQFDRDYAILISEWTPDAPPAVYRNLKKIDGYYNYHKRTLIDFYRELQNAPDNAARRRVMDERLAWMRMRMDPTDLSDGPEDTVFLLQGNDADQNYTALFEPGERVRLRLINGTALTFMDVRIPGLRMTVVQADGQNIEPVVVDELRIGNGETYDVIVQPYEMRAYPIVAEAMARTGMALGTLAPRAGMRAEAPPLRERPLRTLADMAGHTGHGEASGVAPAATGPHAGPGAKTAPTGATDPHAGHDMPMVMGDTMQPAHAMPPAAQSAYRKLSYADLRSLASSHESAEAPLEVGVRLTGVMWRYIWTLNGEKLGEAQPVKLKRGQRVRLSMVNETMMEHPMHLHGFFARLVNGQGDRGALKHTFIVNPGQTVVADFTADEAGAWVFHCHLFYHAMAGMGMAFLVDGLPARS